MRSHKYAQLILLVVVISIIFLFCDGCSSKEKVEEPLSNESAETTKNDNELSMVSDSRDIVESKVQEICVLDDNDFKIIDNGTNIVLGGNYDELETLEKLVSARLSAENNVNDIFVYDDFKVVVNPQGMIVGIDLTTSKFETKRGIKVNDCLSDVLVKYGDFDNSSANELREVYIYYKDDMILTFYADTAGIIVGIKYEYI